MINYKIEPKGEQYMITSNGKIVAQGFGDKESALHSIWVIEGKNSNDFYREKDGIVKVSARFEKKEKNYDDYPSAKYCDE